MLIETDYVIIYAIVVILKWSSFHQSIDRLLIRKESQSFNALEMVNKSNVKLTRSVNYFDIHVTRVSCKHISYVKPYFSNRAFSMFILFFSFPSIFAYQSDWKMEVKCYG